MRGRIYQIRTEMIKRSHRTTVQAFALAGVLALAATATACSSGSDKPVAAATPSSASPTAATTTSAAPSPTADPTAKATTDVLAAYKAFTDYQVTAMTTGHADINKQSAVASGAAYQQLGAELFKLQQAGIIFKGTPVNHPEMTAVDLSGAAGKATLTDCVDSSGWTAVFSATGNSAMPSGAPTRVPVAVSAEQMPDHSWRISQYSPDRGRTC
ncbi:hypothetical protein PUR71_07245 [Streptomyces sp. SP17BM10]|uniref:hypothetical protein n=1 Tax=Streptomyces sp. SP17BM10 TaxID=3002530 RepID=UPI002E7A233F|nr:hypothetical protein [Streptomyces sp. SP17BM10]MEE1782717.1 hypothetical protein [Streptomyces sp. SP17BM10]